VDVVVDQASRNPEGSAPSDMHIRADEECPARRLSGMILILLLARGATSGEERMEVICFLRVVFGAVDPGDNAGVEIVSALWQNVGASWRRGSFAVSA